MLIYDIFKKSIGLLVLSLHPLIFTLLLSASLPSIPGKTLFIFSEPNDALMYFLPSILQSDMPFLLCLSPAIIDEAKQSAKFINICNKLGQIHCIFDTNLSVHGSNWPEKEIKDIILKYIDEIKPQRVFTFGLNNEFENSVHNIQISKALSYPLIHVGQIPIQKLADISLKYQNNTNQDVNSFINEKSQKLSVPVYFLKSGPQLLRYSSYFGPLLYIFTNSVYKGFFVITPPNELISFSVRYSFIKSREYNSWKMIVNMLFGRFFYFNHFLQQQLTSIEV